MTRRGFVLSAAAAQPEVRWKALVFDVFGTVVDWRSSVIRDCASTACGEFG